MSREEVLPCSGPGLDGGRLGARLGDRLAALSGHSLKAGLSPCFLRSPLCTPELENGLKILGAWLFQLSP